MNNQVITKTHPQLPEVIDDNLNSIGKILETFHLPREILADNEEIIYAWRELPRELVRIPEELRDGLIARMCVAISVGLFDGAINYKNLKPCIRCGANVIVTGIYTIFKQPEGIESACHKFDCEVKDAFANGFLECAY